MAALTIPFVKAHGARNDFLLTWDSELPSGAGERADLARAICDRHTGVGADGWIVLSPSAVSDAAIELWNSDGSPSEISGNGTRCAAAVLIAQGRGGEEERAAKEISILTGAGIKRLRVTGSRGAELQLEMNMGPAQIEEEGSDIVPGRSSVILNIGNPQCAVFVDDFELDWRGLGAQLERHPRFPQRTNVSFVRVVDPHTLEVRFFERGAGETMSSGTGSAGAAAAAAARDLVENPVRVLTPAGPLEVRWEYADIFLAGPAEIVARGVFFLDRQ